LDPLCLDYDFGHQTENVVPELDEGWQNLAIAAMEAGFSEEQIFSASQSGGGFRWSGSESSMYAARAAQFETLVQHADARLRKVARIGFDSFLKLRDRLLASEKRAAIRGERI